MTTATRMTPYNECNAREIEMMVGKAMCAYANWKKDLKNMYAASGEMSRALCKNAAIASKNEYEATVRCIELFVKESVYEVQHIVSGRAEAELGVDAA